ncbi:MAG: hypothetical protein ACRDH9_03780 [Actinomycetota bacterium]
MSSARSTWIRGAVSLAVLGVLTAAVLISPVSAASNLTKAKVIKIGEARWVGLGDARYVENTAAPPTELEAATVVVLSLAPSGQSLTLDRQQTVFASAVVRVRSVGAGANGATCDINIAGQDGANSGENTPATANYDLTIPLLESAVLGAGTYDVTVECLESNPDMVYLSGQLAVWAT